MNRRFLMRLSAALACMAFAAGAFAAPAADPVTPAEARALAKEAYVFGYPLVDSYRILHSYFVDRGHPEFKAPWNQIYNNARVFTPNDKAMQTPNVDTPYSNLGLDLRAEPMVLTVPAVEKERYYSVQLNDLQTFIFGYIGSRATGNGAGSYLVVGPGWKGEKPRGIKAVFRSETQLAYIFYRTQLFGVKDMENVKKVQAGFKVQPLSAFLGKPAPAAAPAVDFMPPLTIAQERSSPDFFELLNFTLQFSSTHPSEQALMERLSRIGVGAGKRFDAQAIAPELRQAIQDGMADAWRDIDALGRRAAAGEVTSGDLVGSRDHLKDNYLYRMRATVSGIWGNAKEEAIYPVYYIDDSGERLDGRRRYALRFPPGQLPPANAFWSLTMYELPSRLLVPNALDRYLINSSMLSGLKRDADGGITLHLQHESPGLDREANWLPAPAGPFVAALRLYWPKQAALNGQWKQPPLRREEP
jgi:hypothetical protein